MNRIDTAFQSHEKLLSIYFSAGYPELEDTVPILRKLQAAGVNMVEIGLPFSDPLADGPLIQKSSNQALLNGMTTAKLFSQLTEIRKEIKIPLILMGYLNPLLQYGMEEFCQRCAQIGIDGLIIPDLPTDDYEQRYKKLFEHYHLSNILLITPQTPDKRIRYIDRLSTGFIYVVSSARVTGIQNTFDDEQKDYFHRIAQLQLKTPQVIGFGISNAATYQIAVTSAHGAIVGSAFIKFLESQGTKNIEMFIHSIRK